jgi:DNA repair protein RadC
MDHSNTDFKRSYLKDSGPGVGGGMADADALLALWLGAEGLSTLDSLDRVVQLKESQGGLWTILDGDLDNLAHSSGVPPDRLAQLRRGMTLGAMLVLQPPGREALHSSRDVFRLLANLGLRKRESFWVLCLNNRNLLLHRECVAEGTGNVCILDPKEVFHPVLRCGASRVVFAHNHPSGDPEPSPEDLDLTRRLLAGAGLLGLEVLDHVVIGRGSYRSLMDRVTLGG